ncbi:hypothetical protein HMI01_21440 [Halolactibacillus miurensis]|uniref:Uncharacterized protein n=1 Tax=Halolactibacillus miurensis TaxID=306541 RepID=A0A1I6NV97_9BACI|nr:hypothetical protein HMI01_21440 [Halolactibacillus miurensis]SFS31882.1 hypothetical protein SAMN05421668_1019 [Halolactibacillus miurensis]
MSTGYPLTVDNYLDSDIFFSVKHSYNIKKRAILQGISMVIHITTDMWGFFIHKV